MGIRQREGFNMPAEEWLRAAKTEEERLLSEIVKTDLYKQLEAVRGVLAAYPEAATTTTPPQPTTGISGRQNGSASERGFKTANAFVEMSNGAGNVAAPARPQ
jgi:hypothetical protein